MLYISLQIAVLILYIVCYRYIVHIVYCVSHIYDIFIFHITYYACRQTLLLPREHRGDPVGPTIGTKAVMWAH